MLAMVETLYFIVELSKTDWAFLHIIFYNIICLLLCGTIMWQKKVTLSWLNCLKALACFVLMHLSLLIIDKILMVIQYLILWFITQVVFWIPVSEEDWVFMGALTVYLKVTSGGYLFIGLLETFQILKNEEANTVID